MSDIRERHGQRVREIWVAWAKEQSDPKPSWLVGWDDLSEDDKEVDRRIGAALWGDGFAEGIDSMSDYWQNAIVIEKINDDEDDTVTPDCPNRTTCRNCGEQIVWVDWSYVHPRTGEMDCRPLATHTVAQPVEWGRVEARADRDR